MDDNTSRILMITIALLIGIRCISFLLFFFIKTYKRNNNVIDEEQDVQCAAHYHCPKCNQLMERGLALAGRGIIYKCEDGKPISSFSTINQVLENTLSMSLPQASNRAWHCKHCKHLQLDHNTLIRKMKKVNLLTFQFTNSFIAEKQL